MYSGGKSEAQSTRNVQNTPLIRIIVPFETIGFKKDAVIYKKYLDAGQAHPDGLCEIYEGSDRPRQFRRVNLFIDRINRIQFTETARENWLMVNQELILSDDTEYERNKLHRMDIVLCKSKIAVDLMHEKREKYKFKYKILYTKHTTDFELITKSVSGNDSNDETLPRKNWGEIIHTAGQHPWKQTDAVIRCWMTHPDLPPITITCFKRCFENLFDYLPAGDAQKVADGLVPNIKFHKDPMDERELIELKNRAGCHICPSLIEGYGHYINEGRIVGSVIITSNSPPMNELVNTSSGILIDCDSYEIKRNGTTICIINPDSIYRAVRKYLALPTRTLEQMGKEARRMYVEDTKHFADCMLGLAKYTISGFKKIDVDFE